MYHLSRFCTGYRGLVLGIGLFLGLLGAEPALGAVGWQFQITVPAGINPNDLHIVFTGTGGSIADVTVVPAGGAAVSGGNTIDVTWAAPLAPGTVVTIRFTTAGSPVTVASGYWTLNGGNVGDITGQTFEPVPALSPWGLVVLGVLLGGAAIIILGKRRAAAA